MFERLKARLEREAERRAARQARRIAAALAEALPDDVRVAADEQGVRLSGRALLRRLALEPELKWTMMELIR